MWVVPIQEDEDALKQIERLLTLHQQFLGYVLHQLICYLLLFGCVVASFHGLDCLHQKRLGCSQVGGLNVRRDHDKRHVARHRHFVPVEKVCIAMHVWM